jgi:Flp pilus assembly protein TadD
MRAYHRSQSRVTSYRRLLALDPDNFMAHNNVGLVLAGLGRRSEADAEFGRALELRPDNPHVRFNQLLRLSAPRP